MADRSHWTARKFKSGEEPERDDYVANLTPDERVALVWELTRTQWMWMSGNSDGPTFRRDVDRIVRGRR